MAGLLKDILTCTFYCFVPLSFVLFKEMAFACCWGSGPVSQSPEHAGLSAPTLCAVGAVDLPHDSQSMHACLHPACVLLEQWACHAVLRACRPVCTQPRAGESWSQWPPGPCLPSGPTAVPGRLVRQLREQVVRPQMADC